MNNYIEGKRDAVQAFRGIAVLIVVLFHYTNVFPNGYVGVDIFFVISGFVLAPQFFSLSEKSSSRFEKIVMAKKFLRSRFFRLFPAFFLISLGSLLLLSIVADLKTLNLASKQLLASIFGLGNVASYSISGDYFFPAPNAFIHLWSLSAEIQIYLSILVLALISSVVKISFAKILWLVTLISIIIHQTSIDDFFYQVLGVQNTQLFEYYSPISHIYQFTLGILMAHYRRTKLGHRKLRSRSNLLFSLTLVLVSALPFNNWVPILLTFLTCFALWVETNLGRSVHLKILLWFGNRSYSIYLIHLPMLYIVEFAGISLNLSIGESAPLIAAPLTLAISNLTFPKIEKRFQIKGKLPKIYSPMYMITLILTFHLIFLSISTFTDLKARSSQSTPPPRNNSCAVAIPGVLERCESQKTWPSILLISDSHGGIIGDALKDQLSGQSFNLDLSVVQSCPFFLHKNGDSSQCIATNIVRKEIIESTDYDLIFSTFRNPDFPEWTPGVIANKDYNETSLMEGINFLTNNSQRHFFFTPNSEFTFTSWLNRKLSLESRIKRFKNTIIVNGSTLSPGIEIVDTDFVICGNSTCSPERLGNLLGLDGNHLNSNALLPISDYIFSKLLTPKVLKEEG
jgi:peptidoglycan/LPS O-acetylase OafA/YrhL